MEPSPNLTINCLPDEVLLEIFDSYRQNYKIDSYLLNDYQWKNRYAWFNLAHVCRRWREVMLASSYRLDLNIVVGPEKPGHIKTILSGHLPILIDYLHLDRPDITASAIWRMRAALRHRDRVREICLRGWDVILEKFIRATNYHFPALKSLVLQFPYDSEPDIPATFLRGPDQSDLPLQSLRLYGASLASVSGLLLSTKALTDLTLKLSSNSASVDSLQGSFLPACFQGMQSLRNLDISTPNGRRDSQSQHSTPQNIVPLLKLTRFDYFGSTTFLNNLISGLSAPSLQDTRFELCTRSPLCLSRVIDDLKKEFWSVSLSFDVSHFSHFRLLSPAHSRKIDHFEPSFSFRLFYFKDSKKPFSSIPSTKLAMTEELTLLFPCSNITEWERVFLLGEFLRQFHSVKVLRVIPFMPEVGLYLQQDSDEEYQRRAAEALATFKPFVSARERVGRLVKVYHRKEMQLG